MIHNTSTLAQQLRPLIKLVEQLRLGGWTVQQILDYKERDRKWLRDRRFDPDYYRLIRDHNDEILGIILGTPEIFVQEAC